jgi:hypothetical protein
MSISIIAMMRGFGGPLAACMNISLQVVRPSKREVEKNATKARSKNDHHCACPPRYVVATAMLLPNKPQTDIAQEAAEQLEASSGIMNT